MSDTPLADALKDQYCMSHLVWYNLCGELERELAALRADRDRLDWLMTQKHIRYPFAPHDDGKVLRQRIDAAMGEEQP